MPHATRGKVEGLIHLDDVNSECSESKIEDLSCLVGHNIPVRAQSQIQLKLNM